MLFVFSLLNHKIRKHAVELLMLLALSKEIMSKSSVYSQYTLNFLLIVDDHVKYDFTLHNF